MGMTQIVEVLQCYIEVLAQVQIELTQIEVVARIVVTCTNT